VTRGRGGADALAVVLDQDVGLLAGDDATSPRRTGRRARSRAPEDL